MAHQNKPEIRLLALLQRGCEVTDTSVRRGKVYSLPMATLRSSDGKAVAYESVMRQTINKLVRAGLVWKRYAAGKVNVHLNWDKVT